MPLPEHERTMTIHAFLSKLWVLVLWGILIRDSFMKFFHRAIAARALLNSISEKSDEIPEYCRRDVEAGRELDAAA
jgi:hypothetical protein